MADAAGTPVDPTIGRRVRAARVWRKMDQQVLAGHAEISQGYLSKIENGHAAVEKRATVEKLARALEVAPGDLTGANTFLMPGASEENAALAPLRLALVEVEFGEDLDTPAPPWGQVEQRLRLLAALRPMGDYSRISAMLPGLLRDLHASASGARRREALIGLVDCYTTAEHVARNLGARDLGQVAARHLRDVTPHLDGSEWDALASWMRVVAIGSSTRDRSYTVAAKAADRLADGLDRPEVAEMYGMLHLGAALASTVGANFDRANGHLREAQEIAGRPGVGSVNFGQQGFGVSNVAFWRTALAVEAGEGGRAAEIAAKVDPATLPASPSRRAAWHIDIGQGMAMERRDEEAIQAFRTARQLAPR